MPAALLDLADQLLGAPQPAYPGEDPQTLQAASEQLQSGVSRSTRPEPALDHPGSRRGRRPRLAASRPPECALGAHRATLEEDLRRKHQLVPALEDLRPPAPPRDGWARPERALVVDVEEEHHGVGGWGRAGQASPPGACPPAPGSWLHHGPSPGTRGWYAGWYAGVPTDVRRPRAGAVEAVGGPLGGCTDPGAVRRGATGQARRAALRRSSSPLCRLRQRESRHAHRAVGRLGTALDGSADPARRRRRGLARPAIMASRIAPWRRTSPSRPPSRRRRLGPVVVDDRQDARQFRRRPRARRPRRRPRGPSAGAHQSPRSMRPARRVPAFSCRAPKAAREVVAERLGDAVTSVGSRPSRRWSANGDHVEDLRGEWNDVQVKGCAPSGNLHTHAPTPVRDVLSVYKRFLVIRIRRTDGRYWLPGLWSGPRSPSFRGPGRPGRQPAPAVPPPPPSGRCVDVAEDLHPRRATPRRPSTRSWRGARATKGRSTTTSKRKQALFEAVFGARRDDASRAIQRALRATTTRVERRPPACRPFSGGAGPRYRRIVIQEGPRSLGCERFREQEERSTFANVLEIVRSVSRCREVGARRGPAAGPSPASVLRRDVLGRRGRSPGPRTPEVAAANVETAIGFILAGFPGARRERAWSQPSGEVVSTTSAPRLNVTSRFAAGTSSIQVWAGRRGSACRPWSTA